MTWPDFFAGVFAAVIMVLFLAAVVPLVAAIIKGGGR